MNAREAYDLLAAHSRETALLASSMAVLGWDERTCIPEKGRPHRLEQVSFLSRLLHQRRTDPRQGEWLAAVESSGPPADPLSVEAVNVREWRRSYDRFVKIPEELAVELTKACGIGQSVWEKARPQNDWESFKPCLERVVALKREEAAALGYSNEPYDALLDGYEHGATAAAIEPLLRQLAEPIRMLLDRIKGSAKANRPRPGNLHFPIAQQRDFAVSASAKIGYDLAGGRIDVSAHPFTTGLGPGDVRITTRYSETNFNEAFFGVIHEAGHAIYHQGLPFEYWGLPFCRSASLGIHESQSRMWENKVARSRSFWRRFYPEAQLRFACLSELPLDDFLLVVNEVTPSLIRVEADEVTYNLHVLLRFELEIALMRNELAVSDLPDAWNDKMRKYLGMTPPDFSMGVMQDVHWSNGAIGYFPTYTLGNLYAAHLIKAARRELGGLDEDFAAGEFSRLMNWLRERIHSQGSRYLPRDLIRFATGEDLNPLYLVEYLNEKYGALYDL
jgi:carboxypeptidase Taq